MKNALACLVLALCVGGCQCPGGMVSVNALEPAVEPVLVDYEKYIATGKTPAGTAMSANAKKVREDAIARLRAVIKAAKDNQTAGQ